MDLEAVWEHNEATGLDPARVAASPMDEFAAWFDAARDAGYFEPEAMVLSTVAADGGADSRTVLCRGHDARGFRFYTNYQSTKGAQIDANPEVCLLFSWVALRRQVRARGHVERLDAATSDAYFASRPHGSRLGAWASPQSAVVDSRAELDEAFAAASERFGDDVPRPPHWGGYLVVPHTVELWLGRADRLHDRVLYRRDGDRWRIDRLAP